MKTAKLVAAICVSLISLSAIAHGPKHDDCKKKPQTSCEKKSSCDDKKKHHKKHDHKKCCKNGKKNGKKHGKKNDCHKHDSHKKGHHKKEVCKHDRHEPDQREDNSVEIEFKRKKAKVSIELKK